MGTIQKHTPVSLPVKQLVWGELTPLGVRAAVPPAFWPHGPRCLPWVPAVPSVAGAFTHLSPTLSANGAPRPARTVPEVEAVGPDWAPGLSV